MFSPTSSFDASGFIRKFSLRKKKWPDDYVVLPGSKQNSSAGSLRRCRSHPTSPPTSPLFLSYPTTLGFGLVSPTSSQPLTSFVLAELRAQFSDQLKCIDSKLDLDVTVLAELHEFYRRRALVEQEYSDALAKLVNSLKHKHSNETGKWVTDSLILFLWSSVVCEFMGLWLWVGYCSCHCDWPYLQSRVHWGLCRLKIRGLNFWKWSSWSQVSLIEVSMKFGLNGWLGLIG